MPIKSFKCKDCNQNFDDLILPSDPEYKAQCKFCNSLDVEPTITAHGGYQGSFGGSSTRPKGAGSFAGRKK